MQTSRELLFCLSTASMRMGSPQLGSVPAGAAGRPCRQAEVELSRGLRTPQACKKLGISEQTYYRWRKEYGGLRLDQAKRLKKLERENTRLKKLVADQALDNAILKEVTSGNC